MEREAEETLEATRGGCRTRPETASYTMTSKEEDNVWIRAIMEETLGGDVEGRKRRYFPHPP